MGTGQSKNVDCARPQGELSIRSTGPVNLLTNYANHNMGCGKRISSGLTWAFEQVEDAIILEDDCVPEPDFFPFCEAMLHRYREDERIMLSLGLEHGKRYRHPRQLSFFPMVQYLGVGDVATGLATVRF